MTRLPVRPITSGRKSGRAVILAAVALLFAASPAPVLSKHDLQVSLRVDLGQDVGQNFGTLFEALDGDGNAIAGAGFLGSCNTQERSDRRMLHVYVKTAPDSEFKPQPLPRPTGDAG